MEHFTMRGLLLLVLLFGCVATAQDRPRCRTGLAYLDHLDHLATLEIAFSQPAPVEIILTPPPEDLYIERQTQPDWQAPPMLCHLCGEDRSDGSCGCERPLTQELAEQLQHGMPALLKKAFGDRLALTRPVRIQVIDGATLKSKAGRTAQGLYEDGMIFLSDGLRRREGLAVLAHEYGHAWQYQHRDDIDRVEGLLFEGFAEWVSYHVWLRPETTGAWMRLCATLPNTVEGRAGTWRSKRDPA